MRRPDWQTLEALMEKDKTPLELAHLNVIEVEARVAAQVARIADLIRLYDDTAAAEATLADLKGRLLRCYEERNRLQARARR
jgi:hypothetical protein